ncbi:MAG: retron system putative HNH endonuclease [Acidobacteriota bacterium]
MIRIDRLESPEILRAADPAQKLYLRPEVRQRLSEMQNQKCCYCEKKIDTVGHGQAVEHFRPKAPDKYPELSNTWENLLHACSDCNGAKAQQFPLMNNGAPALIDPSDPAIDPEDHIDFHVDDEDDATFASATAKNKSLFGKKTIDVIKLDIAGRRRARAIKFKELFAAYADLICSDPATRSAKVAAFQALLGANHDYAGFARAFARKKKLDERFPGLHIPAGANVA